MNLALTPGLQWVLGGNIGILVIASVIIAVFHLLGFSGSKELVQRVQTWWLIFALFLSSLLLHKIAFISLMGIVSFLALKEYLSIIPTRRTDRRLLLGVYAMVPLQYLWAGLNIYPLFASFIPLVAILLLHIGMLYGGEPKRFLTAAASIQWGLLITLYSISHVALIYTVVESSDGQSSAISLILFLLLLTELNDVGQFLWGKWLGGAKIVAKVSPNKTWSGALGGIVTSLCIALIIAPLLTRFSMFEAVIAGLLISIGGIIGDLIVSALKRDTGVKDTGTLLPGHGGVLDRIDSLTVAAPLFYYFMAITGY